MCLLSLLLFLLLLAPQVYADSPRILFDQSHRQAFLIEKNGPLQLQGLATIFRQQGWQVESNTDRLTPEKLEEVDALVVSGAFAPFEQSEIDAVSSYLKRGGKLAIMIHIGQPLATLLHSLGVEFANMAINEKQNQQDGKSINFSVKAFQDHPLTTGLKQFRIYGGWPLRPFSEEGKIIASSSPHSWLDLNRDKKFSEGDLMSPFGVMISGYHGRGEFTVFCDDAIFQNQFLRNGNKRLSENLGHWLKSGSTKQVEI